MKRLIKKIRRLLWATCAKCGKSFSWNERPFFFGPEPKIIFREGYRRPVLHRSCAKELGCIRFRVNDIVVFMPSLRSDIWPHMRPVRGSRNTFPIDAVVTKVEPDVWPYTIAIKTKGVVDYFRVGESELRLKNGIDAVLRNIETDED